MPLRDVPENLRRDLRNVTFGKTAAVLRRVDDDQTCTIVTASGPSKVPVDRVTARVLVADLGPACAPDRDFVEMLRTAAEGRADAERPGTGLPSFIFGG